MRVPWPLHSDIARSSPSSHDDVTNKREPRGETGDGERQREMKGGVCDVGTNGEVVNEAKRGKGADFL